MLGKPGLCPFPTNKWAGIGGDTCLLPPAHLAGNVHKAAIHPYRSNYCKQSQQDAIKFTQSDQPNNSFALSFSNPFLKDSISLLFFTFGDGSIVKGSKLLFVSTLQCYIKLISQRSECTECTQNVLKSTECTQLSVVEQR